MTAQVMDWPFTPSAAELEDLNKLRDHRRLPRIEKVTMASEWQHACYEIDECAEDTTPKFPEWVRKSPPRTRAMIERHIRENYSGRDRYELARLQVVELVELCITIEKELVEARESVGRLHAELTAWRNAPV